MKYVSFYVIVICLFFCSAIQSCKKTNPDTRPTQVQVNVKDLNGSKVQGARVLLSDGNSGITDANGSVLFEIQSLAIFVSWSATKGCRLNLHDPILNSLTGHILNTYTSVLYPAGTIQITTANSVFYNVSFNSASPRELNPGLNFFNFEPGLTSMRSSPKNTPGNFKDTIFNLSCGDTTRITLPY